MQHRRTGRRLHRVKNQREALLRSLMRAVVLKGTIVTTEAKAKETRPLLERLITKAKKGSLSGYRLAVSELGKDGAESLKKEIVPALSNRSSGYLRVIKKGIRKSDGSKMAYLQFVDEIKRK